MSKPIKVGVFIFFLILFAFVNTLDTFAYSTPTFFNYPQLTISDTVSCNLYEGDIHFDYRSDSGPSAFAANFLLTDTNNIILQIRDTTEFINVLEGSYFIYALEYKLGVTIQGNVVGNRVTDITFADNCLDFSETPPTPITVCPIPDSVKIVSGKVFYDLNEDGISNDGLSKLPEIALEIYEDNNQNGLIDGADSLLTVTRSDTLGFYRYTIDETLLGRSVTHLIVTTDSTTIPNDRYYTTDNIEVVVFSSTNKNATNNNFGISQTTYLQNEIWLDLNANAVQESIEVNIPNMEICLSNQSPLLINGISYPADSYQDTIVTDENGIFIFENLLDGDWQLIAHHDTSKYIPTYDADGGILNSTNFSLREGIVSANNNTWCTKPDCLPDIKFGFRLAGDLSLSGNVCLDDGSKNGNCSTGIEEPLTSIVLTIFNEAGDLLGGVETNQTGSYVFPNLFEDSYVVHFAKEQISFKDYFFTTKIGATPALKIVEASQSILQKVLVQEDIFGVDFAFFPHPRILAKDDFYATCPGLSFERTVAANDWIVNNLNRYKILVPPTFGRVEMKVNGTFNYTPVAPECINDKFTYQVCDLIDEVCDTAKVSLAFEDQKAPTLLNIPLDITINCDEQIPVPALVSAFDNCPSISIDLEETSSQGEDGCSLYNYTLARTWTATDLCNNSTSATQIIDVKDQESPGIFTIHTLPNGKKLVAGTTKLVGEGWKKINLPIDFETIPLLFYQIITDNNPTKPILKTRNISKTQFELHLQLETDDKENYAYESVNWMAIESGTQNDDFILNAHTVKTDGLLTEIDFSTDFLTEPLFFTNLQSANERTSVTLAYENLSYSGATIELVLENFENSKPEYIEEQLAYLSIENVGDLRDDKGNIIGEVGAKSITRSHHTIPLNHIYHNPIVLVSASKNTTGIPSLKLLPKVGNNAIDIQSSYWGNSTLESAPISISYMVIEGSIPLYTPKFCAEGTDGTTIGVDMVAVDNCDNLVTISHSDQRSFDGGEQTINRIWQASDECKNEVLYAQEISCEGVAIKLQTFLQGALLESKEEGLMRDDLRKKGLIPRKEPYSTLLNFKHVGSGGGEEIVNEDLLNVTGPNAIVDWVFVELRDSMNFDTIIATCSGLLQRDGDVTSSTGDTILIFENIPWGNYYVSIRHRNHIRISSQKAISFGLNSVPKIDFRNVFTPTSGKNTNITISNKKAQWSGDLNGDGKIIYQGPNNDPSHMFFKIILDEQNKSYLTNYISRGYLVEDFNMDGIVIFQGPNNDRSSLLYNTIFAHPNNKNFIANFIISLSDE